MRLTQVSQSAFLFLYYGVALGFVGICYHLWGSGAALVAALLFAAVWLNVSAGTQLLSMAFGRTFHAMQFSFDNMLTAVERVDALVRVQGKHTQAEQVWAELCTVLGVPASKEGAGELEVLRNFVRSERDRAALGSNTSIGEARALIWKGLAISPDMRYAYISNMAAFLKGRFGEGDESMYRVIALDLLKLLFAPEHAPGDGSPEEALAAQEGGQ